ncbi:Zn-dependent metalloprotease [Clostridium cavendishii DSM 21758]|uniref:Zn-dependent metalloprotease n=1 Tax=Clostridium cavendishii DSM 21758 TaxID=1121302 RepID=A0A1M6SRZ3_9CLOT|nr:M4 family metallopeptidase [Clostridium cavendishii]SHK47368.1 Zn-dependent metalloprotease [Clostridium cavendishii DSM 21758]
MKRKLAFIIALSVATSIITPINAYAQEKSGYLKTLMNKQSYIADNKLKVDWDSGKNTPRSIWGQTLSPEVMKSSNDVTKYLQENLDAFNLKGGNFKLLKEEKDSQGCGLYRYKYEFDGITVDKTNLIVHTDKDGFINDISGQAISNFDNKKYSKDFKINEDEALKNALNKINKNKSDLLSNSVEKIIHEQSNKWYSAYSIQLVGNGFRFKVIVNAEDGQILESYSNLIAESQTGTGIGLKGQNRTININSENGIFYLQDLTRPGKITTCDSKHASFERNPEYLPGECITSNSNVFSEENQKAGVDAHYYVGKAYDYYKKNFNREGFDGRGGELKVGVHFGQNEVNAYFVKEIGSLVFGDGDNRYATNFANACDVVSHEFTHGVTAYSSALEYEFQSGALNESFSDVFGCIIEGTIKGQSDWTIGEDMALDSRLMRSLANPEQFGQPAHMKQFINCSKQDDAGGVHSNSGIPNKAFYNIMSTIGVEKAQKIYYRTLTEKLGQFSQFIDTRRELAKVAKSDFGAYEEWAVNKGFYDVGVGENPGNKPSTNLELKEAKLTVDKQINKGDFNLNIAIPANTSAKKIKVTENNKEIINQEVNASDSEVVINKEFRGKQPGTYVYSAEVSDGVKTLTSSLKVTVEKGDVTDPDNKDVKVDFNITSDWGTGANFNLTITNNTNKDLQNWNVEFSFDKKLNSVWDGTLTSLGNNRYRIEGAGWNNVIPSGKSISIGGSADGNSKDLKIYNVKVNGAQIGEDKPDPNKPDPNKPDPNKPDPSKPDQNKVDAWITYKNYNSGDKVKYNNKNYICVQAHLSLPGWEPDKIQSLWSLTE